LHASLQQPFEVSGHGGSPATCGGCCSALFRGESSDPAPPHTYTSLSPAHRSKRASSPRGYSRTMWSLIWWPGWALALLPCVWAPPWMWSSLESWVRGSVGVCRGEIPGAWHATMRYRASLIHWWGRFDCARRLLRDGARAAGDKAGRFNGVLDCFVKTAREEGIGAFYKGAHINGPAAMC
jgi:hypothetical protein